MKTNFLLLCFVCLALLWSCSNDDDSSTGETSFIIPLETGNYWVYDVVNQNGNTRDSLYISNDTIINGNTCQKFKNKWFPTGFYSSSLNNNSIRKDGGKLRLSGSLAIGVSQGLPTDLNFDISNFIIFDANASNGDQLDSFTETTQQNVQGITLNITYTLSSYATEDYASYSSYGNNYTSLKSIVIKLNITVSNMLTGTIIDNQEVLNSKQYIAENIGVVHTNTIFSYSIDPAFADTLGFPASTSQNQQEFLDIYNVN